MAKIKKLQLCWPKFERGNGVQGNYTADRNKMAQTLEKTGTFFELSYTHYMTEIFHPSNLLK